MKKVIYINPKWVKNHYEVLFQSVDMAKAVLGTKNDKNWSSLHESDKKQFPYHLDVKMNGKWLRFADFDLTEQAVEEHRINFPTLIDVTSEDELEKFMLKMKKHNFRGWNEELNQIYVVELNTEDLDDLMEQYNYGIDEDDRFKTHEEMLEDWTECSQMGIDFMKTNKGTYLYCTCEW